MTRINLTTVAKVIKAFGGNRALLEFTGARYRQNISNWRRFGQFPKGEHDRMTKWLDRHGYTAAPELWGQEPEFEIPRKRKKPKGKPVTTGRQGSANGGKHGRRNGKRKRVQVARRSGRKAQAAMAGPLGHADRQAVRQPDAQRHHREGEPAQAQAQETAG